MLDVVSRIVMGPIKGGLEWRWPSLYEFLVPNQSGKSL